MYISTLRFLQQRKKKLELVLGEVSYKYNIDQKKQSTEDRLQYILNWQKTEK